MKFGHAIHRRSPRHPPSGSLEQFGPPPVKNVPIETFDENGLGTEPNNLTAINSLKADVDEVKHAVKERSRA